MESRRGKQMMQKTFDQGRDEIARLVYELYGLTEEEIAIVEGE